MKKFTPAVVPALALALLLTGCAGSSTPKISDGSGSVTVTVVSGSTAAWVKSAIPEFEKKYPNIKIVQNTETNPTLLAKAAQLYASDAAPDLGFLQTNMSAYPLLLKQGLLQPMDDVWADTGMSKAVPDNVSNGPWKADGHYYGIVINQVWAPNLFYNKSLFEEAGINVKDGYRPTETEFLSWIPKLQAAGAQGMAIGGAEFPAKHLTAALVQAWSTSSTPFSTYVDNVPTAGGTELYSQGPFLSALTTITKWNESGVFAKGTSGMTQAQADSLFAAGSTGLLSDGFFALPTVQASPLDFKIGWMMYPTMSTGTKTTFQTYTGSGFVVPKKAKNPVGAKLFAEYLASVDGQALLPAAGVVPIRNDVSESKVQSIDPIVRDMLSKFDSIGTDPIWSPDQSVETVAVRGFGQLLIGQTTPQQLATTTQTAVAAAATK